MKDIEQFLLWKSTYAYSASKQYGRWLNMFRLTSGKGVDEVTVPDILQFYQLLAKKYRPYTIQLAMTVLKNYFRFWNEQGRGLPYRLIRITKTRPQPHYAITYPEHISILNGLSLSEFYGLRSSCILRMLWDTGMRVSELVSLDTEGVDTENRTAVVNTAKTQSCRRIFWGDDTNMVLKKYLVQRKRMNHSPALFVGVMREGTITYRLSTRAVEKMLELASRKAGMRHKITPHSYRHGWAHYRRDHGASLAFIQKGLGHLSPVSTFIYEQYSDPEYGKTSRSFLKMQKA